MATIFDAMPLWLTFVATVGFILLAVETGFYVGVRRARRSEDEARAPLDGIVGSTLGLLAFLLAFTFGMATSRYEARKDLVLDEAIAIRTVDLRAQLFPEPHRGQIRTLLREYVDVRVKGALVLSELPKAIAASERLQDQLWSSVGTLGRDASGMLHVPAMTQALIRMRELHAKRLASVLQNRLPGTIWIALYFLMGLAMMITGYRAGIASARSNVATLVLVLAFSAVIVLVVDLDGPQQGWLTVSQEAMLDLEARLNAP